MGDYARDVLEPWWQRLHRSPASLERIKRDPLAS
jgi:hypothetical protein